MMNNKNLIIGAVVVVVVIAAYFAMTAYNANASTADPGRDNSAKVVEDPRPVAKKALGRSSPSPSQASQTPSSLTDSMPADRRPDP